MTVQLVDSATIVLQGDCPVEDAEPLLQHLLANRQAQVDWQRCTRAHTAVIQVLLAAKATLKGPPQDTFLCDVVEPLIRQAVR